MDYIDQALKREKPTQVRNNLITLRSWLSHFGLKLERKIKLLVEDYVEKIVPSKEQLASILRHCDPRAR